MNATIGNTRPNTRQLCLLKRAEEGVRESAVSGVFLVILCAEDAEEEERVSKCSHTVTCV